MSADHNFWRERRAEADSNRGPSAYQPNALPAHGDWYLPSLSSPYGLCGRNARHWRRRRFPRTDFDWAGLAMRWLRRLSRAGKRKTLVRFPASVLLSLPKLWFMDTVFVKWSSSLPIFFFFLFFFLSFFSFSFHSCGDSVIHNYYQYSSILLPSRPPGISVRASTSPETIGRWTKCKLPTQRPQWHKDGSSVDGLTNNAQLGCNTTMECIRIQNVTSAPAVETVNPK